MFDLKNDFKRIASGHAFELLIVYRSDVTRITNDEKISKLQFETTSEIVERDDKLYLSGKIKAGTFYLDTLSFDEKNKLFVTKWTDEKLKIVRKDFTLELPSTDDEPVTCTFGPAGVEYTSKTHALCRFRLFLEPGNFLITGHGGRAGDDGGERRRAGNGGGGVGGDSGEKPEKDGKNEKKNSIGEIILFWCVLAVVLFIFSASVFVAAVSKT